MITPLLALVAAAVTQASDPTPLAALRVDAGRSEWMVRIDGGGFRPYHLTIICVRYCSNASPYEEDVEAPLGLFRLWDGEPLVYSISASGVAYIVRVWAIDDAGVTRVLQTGSRGRPDFFAGEDGVPMIRTYERPLDASGREMSTVSQPVLWRYEAGKFVQTRPPG